MTPSSPSRIPPKPLVLFVGQVIVLTLLLGYWPTPKAAYPGSFHARGNALFSMLPDHEVRFGPAPAEAEQVDTVMTGRRPGAAEVGWTSAFSANRIGYWPLAALVALILATPMTALRRGVVLATGFLLLDALTMMRVGVEASYAFYELAHGPGGEVRGVLHLLLRVGSEALTATIPSLAAVLVVWVLVARPRPVLDLGILRRILGQPGADSPESSPEEPSGGRSGDP